MSSTIPDRVRDAAAFFLGDLGAAAWVRAAEATRADLLKRWNLEPGEPFTAGVASLCLPCRDRQGRQLVLKIPIEPEIGRLEGDALRCLAKTDAAPALLDNDERSGALLITYVDGVEAYRPQGAAGEVAALENLLERLRSASTEGLPTLDRNLRMRTRWANDRFSLPENLEGSAFLKTAESFTGPLLETSRYEFVHGDLQAKNILVARDHLISIDPFACIGDRLFDAALWNVMLPGPQPIDLVLKQFSGGINSPRLLAWAWVLAAIELRPYLPEHAKRLRSFLLTYQEQATLYVESLA